MENLLTRKTLITLLLIVSAVAITANAETIKVMTFNMWAGGDDWQQCAQEIQSSGADIIGIQEGGGSEMFGDVANYLGFYSDYGTYTLSRWPITEIQGYGYGQAVTICTGTGQEVYMFNCHLTAYPYAPYDLPDTRRALRNESKTQWADLNPILANMASYIATGQPVFLTGDFNVPSHLDYADVAWKCSTECANAGLVDSYWEMNGAPGGHTWPPDWDYDDYGITWTPKPEEELNDKFDRIDLVYYTGNGVFATASSELDGPQWPSDHRAVVSTITIPDGDGGDCGGGPGDPTLSLDKSTYASGEAIVATFGNGPGNIADWIGIYEDGVIPDGDPAATCWYYVDGTQQAGPTAPTDGSVTFDTGAGPTWPLPEGDYDVFFLENDGYGILAGPVDLTISDGGCTPTDIHIEAVLCAKVGCGPAMSNGKATVTIYDDCGNPVADALVDGTFSGDFDETFYDVLTDSNGEAVFTTVGCIKKPSFSFTVDDVTGPLPYDSNDDLATGCSG
jgi:endonuclease/exonuclease/phosphatase (EEP) superfamily protein YafD